MNEVSWRPEADRRRPSDWKPRKPGELFSVRLYLTLRAGRIRATGRSVAARAYRLYREGPPCWLHPVCVLSAGHAGKCKLPRERAMPDWVMRKDAER